MAARRRQPGDTAGHQLGRKLDTQQRAQAADATVKPDDSGRTESVRAMEDRTDGGQNRSGRRAARRARD